MVEIKGIYAASVSVLNDDMSLNIKKTANHCEKIIKEFFSKSINYPVLKVINF